MPKPLKRTLPTLHHYVKGERIDGPNPALSGDCTELWGDCSRLRGNCTGLRGNCTELWGDCTDLSGDLDEIPMAARPCGLTAWTED